MRKMAVLLSGSGRTLDNFHEHIQAGTLNAEIKVVLSNVADALGLQKARNYGY
ncbi:MAG: phosphoribosylglycinamide formyltransferase, partial [Armatimonadetes bacterium]|nr:phosphoribosylglycinamide formyltransferase [Armatimonadota bacterium]